jgi:hypothetical protein
MQSKKSFAQPLMPNKDFKKYNKGTTSLAMKVEGKATLFFHFFAHFLLRQKILEFFFLNLYIFGGGGNFEKILLKKNLKKGTYPM